MPAGDYWYPTGVSTTDNTFNLVTQVEVSGRFTNGRCALLDRIGIEITTVAGAASQVYCTIRSDLNGRPDTCLLVAGPFDGNVLGYQEAVISLGIAPGREYWFGVVVYTTSCSVRARSIDPIISQLTSTTVINRSAYNVAMPVVPVVGSSIAFTGTSINAPKVLVRAA